jgi:hypothetical protein
VTKDPEVFPVSLRGSPVLFVPVLAVLALMIFWLCRVRFRRVYKKFERMSDIAGAQTVTALSEQVSASPELGL